MLLKCPLTSTSGHAVSQFDTYKGCFARQSYVCPDVINNTEQITLSNNYPVPARANVTPVPVASPQAFTSTQGRVLRDHRTGEKRAL